ncbi:DUF3467 domain-containing protein [Gracilimonas mengyeensis]|uniref:DUF3467 domain-containing protein n=1 Tax=Gracilimonas mengyeensis TaxID=1302730 RepID=A0A521AMX1_9BACT|nr:DUF3467 domain-containing protein [Gracilimonas mengyeensis]SMO36142.1 Protein of unknown function [Gracilimonas mengyeensis]
MSKKDQTMNPGKMEIELKEDEATGTYSNLVMITHSPSEFILDFIAVMPGVPKARVVKRMILTPDHAKRLAKALNDNVNRYESEHGAINNNDNDGVDMHMYRGPQPEA